VAIALGKESGVDDEWKVELMMNVND